MRHASLAPPRLVSLLFGLLAGLALAVTATGLGGMVAFSASQRTHEIGVRMALGAEPRRIVGMLLRQGLAPVLLGLALGTIAALATTRLIEGWLYGVSPTDAICFVASAVVLLSVASLACLVPARRASCVPPVAALRHG